jgi:hypothetical protein
MRVERIDHDFGGSTAKPLLPDEAIDPALSRAEPACLENRISLVNSTGKLAFLLQLLVCGLEFLWACSCRTEECARKEKGSGSDD